MLYSLDFHRKRPIYGCLSTAQCIGSKLSQLVARDDPAISSWNVRGAPPWLELSINVELGKIILC